MGHYKISVWQGRFICSRPKCLLLLWTIRVIMIIMSWFQRTLRGGHLIRWSSLLASIISPRATPPSISHHIFQAKSRVSISYLSRSPRDSLKSGRIWSGQLGEDSDDAIMTTVVPPARRLPVVSPMSRHAQNYLIASWNFYWFFLPPESSLFRLITLQWHNVHSGTVIKHVPRCLLKAHWASDSDSHTTNKLIHQPSLRLIACFPILQFSGCDFLLKEWTVCLVSCPSTRKHFNRSRPVTADRRQIVKQS